MPSKPEIRAATSSLLSDPSRRGMRKALTQFAPPPFAITVCTLVLACLACDFALILLDSAAFSRQILHPHLGPDIPIILSNNACNVPLDTAVTVQLSTVEDDEAQYWGQVLGSPDIATFRQEQFQVHFIHRMVVAQSSSSTSDCCRR